MGVLQMSKAELIARMTDYLEDAFAYLATGERKMFYYSAGRANAIERMLDDLFIWDDEHIQNMLDIIDENW